MLYTQRNQNKPFANAFKAGLSYEKNIHAVHRIWDEVIMRLRHTWGILFQCAILIPASPLPQLLATVHPSLGGEISSGKDEQPKSKRYDSRFLLWVVHR